MDEESDHESDIESNATNQIGKKRSPGSPNSPSSSQSQRSPSAPGKTAVEKRKSALSHINQLENDSSWKIKDIKFIKSLISLTGQSSYEKILEKLLKGLKRVSFL